MLLVLIILHDPGYDPGLAMENGCHLFLRIPSPSSIIS